MIPRRSMIVFCSVCMLDIIWNAVEAEQRMSLGGRMLWCSARVELATWYIRS